MAKPCTQGSSLAARKEKLFQLTRKAMDHFVALLTESVPLSEDQLGFPRFHKEDVITLAAEVAKSQVIADFQQKLIAHVPEDAPILSTRVESLEATLETAVFSHMQQSKSNRVSAEAIMHKHVSTLMKTFTQDIQKQDDNQPFESHQVQKRVNNLKSFILTCWGKMRKPGNAEFQQSFDAILQDKMNEACAQHFRNRPDMRVNLEEKAEVEMAKLVQNFETELLSNMAAYGITRNKDWKVFSEVLLEQTAMAFLQNHGNPFPTTDPRHDALNKLCSSQLEESRRIVDGRRWSTIHPEAVRRCVTYYLFSIDCRLYEKSFVKKEELELFHELELKEALEQWDALRIEGDRAAEFKMDLKNKIAKALLLFKSQVEVANKEMENKAKLLVQKYADNYKSGMRKEIRELHKKHADRVRKMLREESSGKGGSNEFISKCEDEMSCFIDNMTHNIAELFQLKVVFMTPKVKPVEKARGSYLPQPFQRFPETERFENMYYKHIKMQLHDDNNNYTEASFETFNEKLETTLLSTFRKFCVLEGKSKNELENLMKNLKRAFENGRHREQTIHRVMNTLKTDYHTKLQEILQQHPDGLDTESFFRLQNSIQHETLKLLKVEIHDKVRSYESLDQYREMLQRYLEVAWSSAKETNEKNLQQKKKEKRCSRKKTLPPLAFHLQSCHVSMAIDINGYVKTLKNESGEEKTPGVVAQTPEGNLVYGSRALAITTSAPTSKHTFTWSVADYFLSNHFSCGKTLTVNGKEQLVTSEFLLGYLLRNMKTAAESQMKGQFNTTIIAIPIWLSSPQRVSVKDAAKLAGFSHVYLVNETSAAAYDFAMSIDRCLKTNILPIYLSLDNPGEGRCVVISENMNRVDVAMYWCSGVEKKLKMISHYGNYKVKEGETKFPKICNGHEKIIPFANSPEEHDVRTAICVAENLVKSEDRRLAYRSRQVFLYILDNSERWDWISGMAHYFRNISHPRMEGRFKDYGNSDVLSGAAKLGQSPANIGSAIQDKLPWDVLAFSLFNQPKGQVVISEGDTLPIWKTTHTLSLKNKSFLNRVTFIQPVLEREHVLGCLGVKRVKECQNVKPILEITNEGIITLSSVKTESKAGGEVADLEAENIQWSSSRLSAQELEALSELMASIKSG